MKRIILTKILALTGTALVWLPMLLTLVTSVIGSLTAGKFLFDYLMPAEMFVIVLFGAVLLLWGAFRAELYKAQAAAGLAAAVLFLACGQAIAVLSGLSVGSVGRDSWAWLAAIASFAVYSVAVLWLCLTGTALCVKLFKK